MGDEEFWAIVDSARTAAAGDPEAQMDILKAHLARLSEAEILEFDRIFSEYLVRAYTWALWGAAYLIGGGCSDDGFMDFRGWLISRGKDVYEKAVADPDSLADVLEEDEDGQIEGFLYVASEAWVQVTGRDLKELPETGARDPAEPAGEPWEDADLEKQFPRLAQRAD